MVTLPETVDVTDVRVLGGTLVMLQFADGVARVLDLKPLMRGPVFDEVFDSGIFPQISVDHDLGTVVWPNGADLSPDVLRYEASAWEFDDSYSTAPDEFCRELVIMPRGEIRLRVQRTTLHGSPQQGIDSLYWLTVAPKTRPGDRIEKTCYVVTKRDFSPPTIQYVGLSRSRGAGSKKPLLLDDLLGSR